MGIDIDCSKCWNGFKTGEDVYCAGCFDEMEDKIEDLQKELDTLQDKYDELEMKLNKDHTIKDMI